MNSLLKRIGKLEDRVKPPDTGCWWIMEDGSEVPVINGPEPLTINFEENKDFRPVSFRYVGDMDPLSLSIMQAVIDRAQRGR